MALQALLPLTKCSHHFSILSPIAQKQPQFFLNKIIRESDRRLSIYNTTTTAKRSQMWRRLKAPLSSPCASNVAVLNDVEEVEDSQRPLEIFTPSPWSSVEIFSSNLLSPSELKSYNKEIELLKSEVNAMLLATAASGDAIQTIRVIDVITRLGLSYHFEEDIEILLNQMFESGEATEAILHTHDLFTVAMVFRVFRQHGYEMSCDVFEKFKGDDGRFKETLSSDAMGLLSMYEAAFLSIPNEDILDEALEFSMLHLKSLMSSNNNNNNNGSLEEVIVAPHLRSLIANALRMPLHKEMPRYGVHQFITYYEQESSKSGVQEEGLLRLAKMDYNMLQNLYRREICECLRWWKELAPKYTYAKDRLVETYLVALTNYYEPRYSRARIISTKILMISFVLDDTYDSFGTLQELECLTRAIHRWNPEAVAGVPNCMKSLYMDVLTLFDELNEELMMTCDIKQRCYYQEALSHVINAMRELCREYMVSIRTLHGRQVPTLEEYMRYRRVTVGGGAGESAAFLGMDKYSDQFDPFLWVQTRPKLHTYVFTICCIKDDIASNPYEAEALQVPNISAIECYMKEHGTTRDEAIKSLEKICENMWKDINKECMSALRIAKVPRTYVTILVNYVRVVEVFFKDGEGLRRPDLYLADYMNKLFFDRF